MLYAGHKNRSGQTEMTDYIKGKIDAYHDMDLKSPEISIKVDRAASTIRSYLREQRTHGYQNLSQQDNDGTVIKTLTRIYFQVIERINRDVMDKLIERNFLPIQTAARQTKRANMGPIIHASREKIGEGESSSCHLLENNQKSQRTKEVHSR